MLSIATPKCKPMCALLNTFKAGDAGREVFSPWGAHVPFVGAEHGAGGRGRVGFIMPGGIICSSAAAVWMLVLPYPAW